MRIDAYTKALLTVIAAALSVIAFRQAIGPADAQSPTCRLDAPCAVVNVVRNSFDEWHYCYEMQRCYSVNTAKP
jgi:hypothetical protein